MSARDTENEAVHEDSGGARPRDRVSQSRVNSRTRTGPGDVAEWSEADPRKLAWALDAVAARGGCLRLGRTRDGGAYAIGVYMGDTYFTDYVRPDEDLDDYLEDLVVWAQQQPEPMKAQKQKSPTGRNRAIKNSQGR